MTSYWLSLLPIVIEFIIPMNAIMDFLCREWGEEKQVLTCSIRKNALCVHKESKMSLIASDQTPPGAILYKHA